MLYTIIVILLILWLLGAFGGSLGVPRIGNGIHLLIAIVIVLLILRILGII